MKEVKCAEWQKNPVPRMMWCWDEDEAEAVKRMVVHLLPENKFTYNVIAIEPPASNSTVSYCHCADIEEKPVRLMTKQELSWWLRDGKHREWSYKCVTAHPYLDYCVNDADEPVDKNILIRENGGAWNQPSSELLD